jgi:hypothetical protein
MIETGKNWQPIETAPKDQPVLLFGRQQPHGMVHWLGHFVFSGHWDSVDEAWVSHGSTWDGPFYVPTHWMPLPPPPASLILNDSLHQDCTEIFREQ